MTRSEKIEALSRKHGNYCLCNDSAAICYCDKAAILDLVKECILAGIALRDAELLAMEFDENSCRKGAEKECSIGTAAFSAFFWGARWQHEQFMKAIKGSSCDQGRGDSDNFATGTKGGWDEQK